MVKSKHAMMQKTFNARSRVLRLQGRSKKSSAVVKRKVKKQRQPCFHHPANIADLGGASRHCEKKPAVSLEVDPADDTKTGIMWHLLGAFFVKDY